MPHRVIPVGTGFYFAVMYSGLEYPVSLCITNTCCAPSISQIIDCAVAMIENAIGDEDDGNRAFVNECRKSLQEHGVVRCESDMGGPEWSVQIFQTVDPYLLKQS